VCDPSNVSQWRRRVVPDRVVVVARSIVVSFRMPAPHSGPGHPKTRFEFRVPADVCDAASGGAK